MKIIAKLTIVSSRSDSSTSQTKHILLGDSIILDDNEHVEKITLNGVKMVYSENDNQEGE